jgi:hypothetical protein
VRRVRRLVRRPSSRRGAGDRRRSDLRDDRRRRPGTPSVEHDGETIYFCCEGCKTKFVAAARACRRAGLSRSSPGSCSAPAARAASAPPSSCSPTATARCSATSWRRPRVPFDQLVVAIGGAADEVRSQVDLSGAEVVVNDAYGAGCSSSIAAALGHRSALRGDRADARRPAGRQRGHRRGAARRPRRLAAGRVPLRRRARAPDRVRAQHLRRARRPPRRQGRLAAARPARRRRGRGAVRARSRSTSTRRGLRGGARQAGADAAAARRLGPGVRS